MKRPHPFTYLGSLELAALLLAAAVATAPFVHATNAATPCTVSSQEQPAQPTTVTPAASDIDIDMMLQDMRLHD